ncbi:MAG: CRISPR-associated helicase Cas3', partial [Thermodesulfovibrionales bacterium]
YDPYPHQLATYEALEKGESVILRAPTGSGKSEAAFIPFTTLRGSSLPKRMIYTLPMRALVNSLCDRFKSFKSRPPSLDIKAQHGQRLESILFDAECIIATLDQVITSYACAPLSLGVRHGNIPAGAVAGSFLVFDEVHTFEPLLGLQSSLILAERLKNLSIPFVIMSATLPTRFASALSKRFSAKIIEVEEEKISVRINRAVSLKENLGNILSPEIVLNLHKSYKGKTIVVCNTVERAINIYKRLKDKIKPEPILIHSRFIDEDRARKEDDIKNLFGQNNKERALLISTQVIEVGMDISCNLLITELAPIDSLIQRAGRCARWGGEGEIFVFGIPHHAPYDKFLINKTKTIIENNKNKRLTWELEKEMVDQVLEDTFMKLAKPVAGTRAMMYLSKAAFEGKPVIAEKAVRDAISVEVSIHNEPESIGDRILTLPRLKIQPEILKQFFAGKNPKMWLIEQDRNFFDDYIPQVKVFQIRNVKQIHPNDFYILHSDYASYNPDEGLILGKAGAPFKPVETEKRPGKSSFSDIPFETWKKHAQNTLEIFEKNILPEEDFLYSKLAFFLNIPKDELLTLFRLTLLLHDLGKLTEEWQYKIGAKKEFLAHSGDIEKKNLPPHATVSAYILGDYLREFCGNILGDAAFFAIAHHHSVRAVKVPKYRLSAGWHEEMNNVLSEKIGIKLDIAIFKDFEKQDSSTTLSSHIPAFEKEKTYDTYVILSRALRLADRRSTIHEHE